MGSRDFTWTAFGGLFFSLLLEPSQKHNNIQVTDLNFQTYERIRIISKFC